MDTIYEDECFQVLLAVLESLNLIEQPSTSQWYEYTVRLPASEIDKLYDIIKDFGEYKHTEGMLSVANATRIFVEQNMF